jgi:hypothetical protein
MKAVVTPTRFETRGLRTINPKAVLNPDGPGHPIRQPRGPQLPFALTL